MTLFWLWSLHFNHKMKIVVTFSRVNQGLFMNKIIFKILCKYQLRRRHLLCFRPFCKTFFSSNSTIFQVRPTCDKLDSSSFSEFTIAGSGSFISIVSINMSFDSIVVISTSFPSTTSLRSSQINHLRSFLCTLMLEVCPASSGSYQ